MDREDVMREIAKPFLRPLGIMQILYFLAFISTPFIWIWFDWFLAWRIGLSGFIGVIVAYGIYNLVKKAIYETVSDELDKIEDGKITTSKFQEKLNKAMEALRQSRAK